MVGAVARVIAVMPDGQELRASLYEVGLGAACGHPLERVVHDLLDVGAHRLDSLDQEVTGDHAAQPGVFWVVEAEEAGVGGEHFPPAGWQHGQPWVADVRTEAAVGQYGADLGVAGH
ncbi:hypothetical protein ACFXPT_31070 [Streptomyces goshikiensis]|uniref:hypothetical protein n=1 Tax=Streptomyces goshikiensis TaxID=1942 RepID=UPI00369F9883